MSSSLDTWVADADSLRYADRLGLKDRPAYSEYVVGREEDYFISLTGALFDRLRQVDDATTVDWELLGNAFAEFTFFGDSPAREVPRDTTLYSAAAFYMGGFSASARLMLSSFPGRELDGGYRAAYELMARPRQLQTEQAKLLLAALEADDLEAITSEAETAREQVKQALVDGPEEWVGWRLYQEAVSRFERTNVRIVLPERSTGFWDGLVGSFLKRPPPVWDFFPSQISAIESGLLDSDETFSLQMPTGAGKTALTEAVLYSHLHGQPEAAAVLLVPYRALAKELRDTMVPRLRAMGINSRSIYGGTIPSPDELGELTSLQALIATPESLAAFLSADPDFFHRISLVICDEGHLLDSADRGVSLELLLARMRVRAENAPRFVYVSAIVPNIEEVHAWLGGSDSTVVRSDFRPALAEFARLDVAGAGPTRAINLKFHPHDDGAFDIEGFLKREEFLYVKASTGRQNTYSSDSVKTVAVAAARKLLPMGPVAVFGANKRGKQGCVGLALELLNQLDCGIGLPNPREYASHQTDLEAATEYLNLEYGPEWVGTRLLIAGALIHHGDIPQETREVFERLLRRKTVILVFCTNTLAEGVNLPLRSMVLYSVQRRGPDGRATNLLERDIKNLVGRAGRAGSTTRGLVVCANPNQWNIIEPVALQAPGEPVRGALIELLENLRWYVLRENLQITNELLEEEPDLYSLVDGVDATLVDLAVEGLDEEQLIQLAAALTEQTYAYQSADKEVAAMARQVFELRARRVWEVRAAGRLPWIHETGARTRLLPLVEESLYGSTERWSEFQDPTDPELVDLFVTWFWSLPGISEIANEMSVERESFGTLVTAWLAGTPHSSMAELLDMDVDDVLGVQSRLISYELQTAAEQGVALLARLVQTTGNTISPAVSEFPEHLRFGVPNTASRVLATVVRHRRAAVALGTSPELSYFLGGAQAGFLADAVLLLRDAARWTPVLGSLVLQNTVSDLEKVLGIDSPE